MRRWIESCTVYDYEGEDSTLLPAAPQSVANVPIFETDESADSDDELQDEITRLLHESAARKLRAGDMVGAEKLLRNCLSRMEIARMSTKHRDRTMLSEVITTLYEMYHSQRKWTECQGMLLQRMAINERLVGRHDPMYLADVLSLANLMKIQEDTAAAQLHARRALNRIGR